MTEARWDATLRDEARARGMSGHEVMRAMVEGRLPHPPMAQHLGLRLVEVGDGRAVMRVTPGPEHANAGGFAHGGLAATLIDSVTGCALWTTVDDGAAIATVELNVTYVRPVGPDAGELVAEAEVVHSGGSIGVASAEVRDTSGALCATGRATYAVLRPRA